MEKIKIIIAILFIFIGSIAFKMFNTTTINNSAIKYNIMIGNTKSTTFPSTNTFTVSVSCTSGKATVTWNPNLATPAWEFKFENGYVNNNGTYTRTNITSNDSCDIVFTPRTSSNKLNSYIKSLLNGGSQRVFTTNVYIIKNEGTTAGEAISNGTTTYYHDKGIRYEGSNPDNYIKFNNELWRIIGIFREAKDEALSDSDTYYTKIIRNENIGGYSYNTVANTAVASDAYAWWSLSDGRVANLNYMLNHFYIGADNDNYNGTGNENCKSHNTITRSCDFRVVGIQPGWRDMVINTTWYTAIGANVNAASTAFSGERGSAAGAAGGELSYKDTTDNKYSRVGLVYPSDYLYSGNATSTRWLLQNEDCTISPNSSRAAYVWGTRSDGGSLGIVSASGSPAVRPTVYLSDSVYITGGTGTILDPYTIAM